MTEITGKLSAALADRYRIESHLGEGGMATVYLAEDLKHERKVAVKVLRPELAAVLGAERFLQEIKTTANLQHPHILPLFDSGEADGFLFYVMPFIDGETLRGKLDRETQLGIDEAVKITTEIADALNYAHNENVIHRDIKPENILLHNGRPMVADFGIALAVSAAAGGRMTETGLSLGTPHYMSPEQATAEKDLTNRSDIYSLGSMLYEMLTGEPPHMGNSAQQIIMKIVTDTPRPVTELRKSVPANVTGAVAKSLEKLAADRFTSAAAFGEALTNPAFALPATQVADTGLRDGGNNGVRGLISRIAVMLLVVVALWGWLRPVPESAKPVIRYTLNLPEDQRPAKQFGNSFALSPDGSRFIYAGPEEQLWLIERDQLEGRPLPGTNLAWHPFFSPDGERVAFITGDRQLKVVSLTGEPPLTLVSGGVGRQSGAWSSDGHIYFTTLDLTLSRVAVTGAEVGVQETISTIDSTGGVRIHGWPDALPDGKGILFTVGRDGSDATPEDEIAVVDLTTGEQRTLVNGVMAKYAVSGHLVYVQMDGTLLAAPFDLDEMAVTGPAVPLLGQVDASGFPDLTISADGRLIYQGGGANAPHQVVWVERDGATTPVDPDWQFLYTGNGGISLSPDGSQLALRMQEETGDIWIKSLDRGPLSRLTLAGSRNYRPRWTPDGTSITFLSNRNGSSDVFSKSADGTGTAKLVLDLDETVSEAVWSPAGDWLLIRTGAARRVVTTPENVGVFSGGVRTIRGIRPGVDDVPIDLLVDTFDQKLPALSPDGRWLAYVSTESGIAEVFVRPFPDVSSSRQQVSIDGGNGPMWAHNGRELFFQNRDNEMVSVAIETGESFRVRDRTTLFPLTGFVRADFFNTSSYDVSPDDQRFIMVRRVSHDQDLIVVENFFEELKEKVGN